MSDPSTRRRAVLGASVLCAVALLTALAAGVLWAVTVNGDSVRYAQERDEVVRVGSQAIINFNTLDYRDVERGLDLWARSSTGALHDQVIQGRKQYTERIRAEKSTTRAEVLDAAVTQLDDRAGTATMLAVVKVTVTPEGQQPVQKRSRYQAQLSRDGDEWKLSGIAPVSVG